MISRVIKPNRQAPTMQILLHTRLILSLLVALITSSGCTNSYRLEQIPLTDRAGSDALVVSDSTPVQVSLPIDGTYGEHCYLGSGRSAQQAVISTLRAVGVDAQGAPSESSPHVGGSSRPWRVEPRIIEWEDRATEWSGKPDRIRIELNTVDGTGKVIDAAVVSGSSKWATFGGDHPQDMLLPALTPWAARFRPHRATP